MSFKDNLLQIYSKYDLTPTSLSEILHYNKSEKIARLTRNEKNLPSIKILRDILNAFEEIDARWLITGKGEMISAKIKEPKSMNTKFLMENFKELIDKQIKEQIEEIILDLKKEDQLGQKKNPCLG